MEIRLKGHDKRYEVEQTAMLFFGKDRDIVIESTIDDRDGFLFATASVTYQGTTEKETKSIKNEGLTPKKIKDVIKLSVFLCCSRLTDKKAPWGILTGVRPVKPIRDMLLKMSEEDVREFLTNEYLLSDEKISLALSVAKKSMKIMSKDKKSAALYIGIPFCPTRCSYCSFTVAGFENKKDLQGDYLKCLQKEIADTAHNIRQSGMHVDTVYVGGGTPTTPDAKWIYELINCITGNFDMTNVREFTVEAGRPDTVTKEKLGVLKDGGVMRISINPQTLHDETLKTIGRNHSVRDFYNAFYMAREMGFDNINTDIISGLPGENVNMFKQTLDGIKELSPENLTVHTLYIKRTAYLKNSGTVLPDDKTVCDMMSMASEYAVYMDMAPYYLYKQRSTLGNLENIGYSKNGRECIYNVNTMEDVQTVIALGAGGVSKLVRPLKIERIFNFKNPYDYINNIDEMINRKHKLYEVNE